MLFLFLGRSWWALGAWMKVGMSMMHLTLFSNLTVPSPYIHAPNRIAGFHVKLVPRIFVWIPLPHAQSWSRHCECCLVCLAVLRRHWTQQVQKKEASFCKKPCLASMDPLSVCVCMPALVVAVLIAYDYECARKLSASLFLGSQKQAFLASWLWALIVYIMHVSHFLLQTHGFSVKNPWRNGRLFRPPESVRQRCVRCVWLTAHPSYASSGRWEELVIASSLCLWELFVIVQPHAASQPWVFPHLNM